MQTLNEKEKKQIERYCIYPKIALRALIISFVLCALIVPLEMIDDLVFHNDGFQPTGIDTGIALIALCVTVFCLCALCPKFGMRGKQWIGLPESPCGKASSKRPVPDSGCRRACNTGTSAVRLLQKQRQQDGTSPRRRSPSSGSGWRGRHRGRHAFGKRAQQR